MRKNAPRKWIHAILDLLPILIIPIFAININQKSVEPISIEVQEKISVDFNQLNHNPIPNNDNYYESYNTSYSTVSYENNTIKCEVLNNQNNLSTPYLRGVRTTGFTLYTNHKYLMKFDILSSDYKTYFSTIGNRQYQFNISLNTITHIENIYQATGDYSTLISYYPQNQSFNSGYFCISNWYIFDLTQMFGVGNEPTIQEFNSMIPNAYYPYTESQKMLVDKSTPTTYDDTDIGSQFLYSLYKPINDYFNFNNLFNMNDVWQWIQLNLFQGTTPLPVFMVWNIILYEFFMDLIFLLYAVFMFVIDFATCLMDSFMNKARKGV